MERRAKFNIGDFVVHKRRGYRAIVVDIDPSFQASGPCNPGAHRYAFTERHPWYRLLVDKTSHATYVEETCLDLDQNHVEIDNPHVRRYLNYQEGRYVLNTKRH